MYGHYIGGEFVHPNLEIVSMYIDQFPSNDLSRDRSEEFGIPIHHTIASALRCGGNGLAVDGEYPRNELGQRLYPRHEFFRQIVRVFQQDAKVVPVFVDKHLSYEFEKAEWMVKESRRGNFPMLAGSSIPLAWRLPALELPLGCEIEDALAVGYGPIDSYDYHALEGLQCMVERRKGGESGVKAVRFYEGDAVWQAGDEGVWSWELLEAAMSRSDSPSGNAVEDGRPENVVGLRHIKTITSNPMAYVIEYNDGLRATMLLLDGATKEFLFAGRLKGDDAPVSTQFFLSPVSNVNHFAALVAKIEKDTALVTGESPYPVERTLLVSGVLEACLKARHEGVSRLETPDLESVSFVPSADSHFHHG